MALKLPLQKQNNIVQNIIDETPVEDIINEINTLKNTENKRLFLTVIMMCFLPNQKKFLP
jgi:hypothetical protein